MYDGGDLICNTLTIQQRFDPYSEFPHLFPTEKPTELPPLREPMEIMQHKMEVIEGAEWHPNYIPCYDRFEYQITEKINKELEISAKIKRRPDAGMRMVRHVRQVNPTMFCRIPHASHVPYIVQCICNHGVHQVYQVPEKIFCTII